MRLRHPPHQGQAQAEATRAAIPTGVQARERFEDFLPPVHRHARPVVVDLDFVMIPGAHQRHLHSLFGIANGIAQQVDHRARHEAWLDAHLIDPALDNQQLHPGRFGLQRHAADHAVEPTVGLNILPGNDRGTALKAGVGQQFRDHFFQLAEVGVHVGDQFTALARIGLLLELIEFERQPGNRRA